MPRFSARAGARDADRKSKLDKLLEDCRSMAPESLRALARYLVAEKECTIVPDSLRALDVSVIPRAPKNLSDLATANQSVERASVALNDLTVILEALDQTDKGGPAEALKTDCLGMLLEQWIDIARWVAHLFQQMDESSSQSSDELRVTRTRRKSCRAAKPTT
ncbi:hypothetical protein NMY22_g15848 [Coprinellus aureogranulatus]|nr:hypothetical protein NMY22_g15848 [Coprinellus aureogranulatus]